MAFDIGWILGPLDLVIAIAALYLVCKYRSNINPKFRLILDFTAISIVCAVFWGVIGGTARDLGLVDPASSKLLSEILSTLYLVFAFLAVWYSVNNFDGIKKHRK